MYSGVPQNAADRVGVSDPSHPKRDAPTVCLLRLRHVEFAETKIAQSDGPGVIQEDVLGFQITSNMKPSGVSTTRHRKQDIHIPIHNVEPMEMLQRTKQFSCVEPATILVELAFTLKVVEQFSAIDCNSPELAGGAAQTHREPPHRRT